MILEFIMNIIKAFLLFIISLFPVLPDMTSFINLIAPIVEVLAQVNHLIDIRVLSACLVALILMANAELIWGVIMWVIRKIPGVT